jgi:DNA polymerase
VQPKVIVAMGASAVFALTRRRLAIGSLRGRTLPHPSGAQLVATYHPSAILRGHEDAEALFRALRADLQRAASLAI